MFTQGFLQICIFMESMKCFTVEKKINIVFASLEAQNIEVKIGTIKI